MQSTSWALVEAEALGHGIIRQALHGELATMARFRLPKGSVVRRHAHPNEQFTSILEGALKLKFDDQDVVVRAGQMLRIPPHVPHEAEALDETIAIDFFAPRREDWIRREDSYLRS